MKCPFEFPDASRCGRVTWDHHLDFCWGKNPDLCNDPKIKGVILHKLKQVKDQSANLACGAWGDDEDSDDDYDV